MRLRRYRRRACFSITTAAFHRSPLTEGPFNLLVDPAERLRGTKKMISSMLVILLICCGYQSAMGYNVLLATMGGTKSHTTPFVALGSSLKARGHNVTLVSAFPGPAANHGLQEFVPPDFEVINRLAAFLISQRRLDCSPGGRGLKMIEKLRDCFLPAGKLTGPGNFWPKRGEQSTTFILFRVVLRRLSCEGEYLHACGARWSRYKYKTRENTCSERERWLSTGLRWELHVGVGPGGCKVPR